MKVKPDNIVNYSIISFGLYPIMPNSLKGIFMISIFLSGLYYHFKKEKKEKNIKLFIINSGLFFIYVISMLYSDDLYHGFKKLGPAISILLFPIVFLIFLNSFEIKRDVIQKTLNLFTISTLILMIFFMFHFKYKVLPIFPYISFFDPNYIRSYLRALPLIGQHPIYIGIYIGISFINVTNLIFDFIKGKTKCIFPQVIILMFLLFSLLYVSSKGIIFSLILIGFIIYNIKAKNKILSFAFSSISFGIILIIIFFTPYINKRFKELINLNTYSTQKIYENNSSQIRIAVWKTSFENIKKSPLFGYGIGDVQQILDNDYKSRYPVLLKGVYNSHNQYLSVWLSTGIIGLIFFIYLLFFNFKIGLTNNDLMFVAVLLFFFFGFLTENILDRQTGATLFFFYLNLFGTYNFSKKQLDQSKD